MDKRLHIISFDVPSPPDYGGVIDIYYKLKALHEEGVKITLHCFEYGRGEQKELEKLCEKVYYYKRKASKRLLFSSFPYIVATRSSEALMQNLLKDGLPILFEGLHCCFHLGDSRIKDRKKIVRMHNIEHTYYANLGAIEKNFFRKRYFEQEAKKLEKFEPVLLHANAIAAISPSDTQELSKQYKNVSNVMAFHPHEKVEILPGKSDFVLYHGSLAVGENNKAALYLVNEVFNDLDIPLVIAGNGASAELKEAIKDKQHISLRSGISTGGIYSLLQSAQVNILPTFQATGIKLKLLSALYCGRHCIVNTPMVQQTGLESLCAIADTPSEMKKEIARLMNVDFSTEEKLKRSTILQGNFSNKTNVRLLMKLLF